jgi:hypothetical protein
MLRTSRLRQQWTPRAWICSRRRADDNGREKHLRRAGDNGRRRRLWVERVDRSCIDGALNGNRDGSSCINGALNA